MNRPIKPIEKPAGLADQVFQQLRSYIGSHQVRPGDRLQEAGLAMQLGVSRTPVREALARLESEGLICAEGRGFVIPELTDSDIDEIYEIRFLLEPAALGSVVKEFGGDADLAGLSGAIADAVAADKNGDVQAFIEANSRFHNAWRILLPNRRMSKLLDQYVGHVRFLRVLTLVDAASRRAALKGMKNIHAALKKRDPDAAARSMHEHLETAKHFLIKAVEKINREKEAESSASTAHAVKARLSRTDRPAVER